MSIDNIISNSSNNNINNNNNGHESVIETNVQYTSTRQRVREIDPSVIKVDICKCCHRRSYDSPKTKLSKVMFTLGFFFFFTWFYNISKIRSKNHTKKRYSIAAFLCASLYIYTIVILLISALVPYQDYYNNDYENGFYY